MTKFYSGLVVLFVVAGIYWGTTMDISALGNPGAIRSQPETAAFNKQIESWISALANEPSFSKWKNATWESYPLGPGTHGWVVIIMNNSQEIGYLIIHAAADGQLQLSEYGAGEHPLFSQHMLYQSLVQHGLIASTTDTSSSNDGSFVAERIYVNALHAVWKVTLHKETYYFDAKTGELYPLTDPLIAAVKPLSVAAASNTTAITERKQMDLFDPFERVNWLTHKPAQVEDVQQFYKLLHHEGQVTYTAQLYNRTILAAFAITGYHLWNDDRVFVAMDQEGVRYIPYEQMIAQGNFYQ